MNNKSKPTIFCDIDGTLLRHGGDICEIASCESSTDDLLPNAQNAIRYWDKSGYTIILTTGRKESLRAKTEAELTRLGIVYDQLVMGLGGGKRIIINDRKEGSREDQCQAINISRNKGLQYFDFEGDLEVITEDKPKVIEKPWGSEELIAVNSQYVVKRLRMNKGHACSLQYHEQKCETVVMISGKLELTIGESVDTLRKQILMPGDSLTIDPLIVHRMSALEDSEYLEASTTELKDVVRLEDSYGRNTVS